MPHQGEFIKQILKQRDITQEMLANDIGVSRGHIINKLKEIEIEEDTKETKKKLLEYLRLTVDDLPKISKQDKIAFLTAVIENVNDNNNVTDNIARIGIPMYNEPAAAGAVEIYSDVREDQPAFFVNIPQFRDCDFGKMIFGHSMYPTYENGSYLFMKRQFGQTILPGEAYYIETVDYKVVKRLQLGDTDDTFIAESDNPELRANGKRKYESFPIRKTDILKLSLVKGSLKQNQN